MNQPTEEQLYEVKCGILAQKLSEAYNDITYLQWANQQQSLRIQELENVSSDEATS
jgi:hypothetical protein